MIEAPRSHRDLEVYKRALHGYAFIARITATFPNTEKFELVAQMRAAARSVCSCLAEGWRKRNYPAAFASKLTEAESEAAETQTWADIAAIHTYIAPDQQADIIEEYDHILAQLVRFRRTAIKWKGR
jgi:four helix bundle protein